MANSLKENKFISIMLLIKAGVPKVEVKQPVVLVLVKPAMREES